MNQILLTDNDNNKRRNSNKNYNRNNSNDIKKIIIFFAVVILVFGIAIAGIYGYKTYKNSNKQERPIDKPKLALENTENEVTIVAEAEAGIDKIIYSWNDEEETIKEMNGRTKQEEQMEIPYGENILKVKVIDLAMQEQETSKNFSRENPITINTSVENEGKLRIVATSEAPIKYMSYKWNEEEEIKIEPQNEQDITVETTIDIKRGQNKLTIIAVDINENTNKAEKNFEGKLKPEINVYQEDSKLYMKISHDMGLKKVEFNVNGTNYVYDESFSGYEAQKQEIEYHFDLIEGENTIIINAISNEDTEDNYAGKCNYTAE